MHDPGEGHCRLGGRREEAAEWAGGFPNPALGGGAIEVREIFELEDFGAIPGVERFRDPESANSNK